MDGALQAIFNSAQTALKNDALQTLYNGAQARQNAFAKINNAANQSHMLFSGMPKAKQIQYDAGTFIPGMASAVTKSLQQQEKNQEMWDKFSKGIKEINEQAAKIESAVPSSFK